MNQRPAYLPARTNKLAEQAVSGLGGSAPPHLSIRQNRFTLVDGAGNEKPFSLMDQVTGLIYCDVVIADVNANVSKIYYAEKYDPAATEFKPPTCFSDNGIGPSAQSQTPQCLTCAACEHNVWGSDVSAVSGKQTKACNDLKKIAFIAPGVPDVPAFLLRIPPATLKHFKAYAQTVAGHGADICDVVTRVSFDPQTQGVLNFAPTGWLDEGLAARLSALEASKATDALVGRNDIPNTRPIGLAGFAGQQPALPPPAAMSVQAAPIAPPAPPAAPPAFMQAATPAPAAAFQPPPLPPQGFPATQAASPVFGAVPGATQPDPAPPRRTRRTKEQIAADNAAKGTMPAPGIPFGTTAAAQPAAASAPAPAAAPPVSDESGIPPFLRRQQAPAAPAPQQSFGMATPQPAPANLEAQLTEAFKLPT